MKHEKIDNKARVWTIERGTDGQIRAELEEGVLATLDPMAEAVIIAAGRDEIAATRAW
jgi:hypothetical protein